MKQKNILFIGFLSCLTTFLFYLLQPHLVTITMSPKCRFNISYFVCLHIFWNFFIYAIQHEAFFLVSLLFHITAYCPVCWKSPSSFNIFMCFFTEYLKTCFISAIRHEAFITTNLQTMSHYCSILLPNVLFTHNY